MTHTNENLEYALSRTRRRLELLEALNHPYAQKVREAGLSWRDLDSREALADLPVHAAENLIRSLAGEAVPIVNPAFAAAR